MYADVLRWKRDGTASCPVVFDPVADAEITLTGGAYVVVGRQAEGSLPNLDYGRMISERMDAARPAAFRPLLEE